MPNETSSNAVCVCAHFSYWHGPICKVHGCDCKQFKQDTDTQHNK
jgi:hypothetical protein